MTSLFPCKASSLQSFHKVGTSLSPHSTKLPHLSQRTFLLYICSWRSSRFRHFSHKSLPLLLSQVLSPSSLLQKFFLTFSQGPSHSSPPHNGLLLGSSYKSSLPSFKTFLPYFTKPFTFTQGLHSLTSLLNAFIVLLTRTYLHKELLSQNPCFIYPPWDLCSPLPQMLVLALQRPPISPLTGFSSSPPTGTLLPQKSSFPPSTQCSCGLTFSLKVFPTSSSRSFLAAPPPNLVLFLYPQPLSAQRYLWQERACLPYLLSLPSLPTLPSLWYFVSPLHKGLGFPTVFFPPSPRSSSSFKPKDLPWSPRLISVTSLSLPPPQSPHPLIKVLHNQKGRRQNWAEAL